MTRFDLRFPVLLLAALLTAGAATHAVANDHPNKTRVRQPFKDLPGVKIPRQQDDQAQTACTSSIERQHPTRRRNGLGYRVYRCETDVLTLESTREPDEVDWRKQQLYYKPWIGDGF